uniref:Uncharacterized protein n=1 Tax=Scophthalmus maximus TaxID=52904 RepID=A0A8D3EDV8_SCOMX
DRERQTERQRERQTDRQRERQTDRETDRHSERDRQTERETDRHSERDRQTERQTGSIINADTIVETKWKRQSAAGLELLAEAGRMFLPAHFLYPPAPPTPELYLYRGHTHHHTAPPLLHHILAHTEPHAADSIPLGGLG